MVTVSVVGVGVGRGETREGMGRQTRRDRIGDVAVGLLGGGYWIGSIMASGSRIAIRADKWVG